MTRGAGNKTRASSAPGRALVEWRDGAHMVGTPLWFDARRAREVCFVASARSPVRRHRQRVATGVTTALLDQVLSKGRKDPPATLSVPYGRPFSLGSLRLELYPSGHMPGAASVVVASGDVRVAYAGSVQLRGGLVTDGAQARKCDCVILDATYGHPRFRFPPARQVRRDLVQWAGKHLADGSVPILLCDPLSGAPEVLAALGKIPVRAHRTIAAVVKVLHGLGVALPPVKHFAGTPAQGEVILWPVDGRGARALAAVRRPRFALVSGWALDPEVPVRLKVDAAFPLADRAGHGDLLEYVEQCGAGQVFLTGGGEDLVAPLRKKGASVRLLGPPEQLPLF